MQKSDEEEEKSKKNDINKNNEKEDFERYSRKKSTLTLSEIPKIINDELNNDLKPKKSISHIFLNEQALLYPKKLKKSFINEPININNDKDESKSCLEEIKKIIQIQNERIKENKDDNNELNEIIHISKEKKDKEKNVKKYLSNNILSDEHRLYSNKKKNRTNKLNIPNRFQIMKNKDNDNDNDIIINENKGFNNDKNKKFEFRKSDFSRSKKDNILLGMTDSPKKKAKRKSIISQPNVSPSKIYTTEIFKKFFSKKISFEEKTKRNEDKIYINIPNKEELFITVNTTQETIKNYYEYMQECFQIIDLNFNKNVKLQNIIEPINFNLDENKKVVIFELESTLVSYYIEDLNLDNGSNNTLGINIRPHLIESLNLIKNNYNIVIYSAGSKNYVDAILDFIDPEHNYFNFRLYREHCNKFIINDKIYFTKNLNIFKNICSLKDIVMVDCSVIGFGFFLENGIPIIPYYDSKEDVELKILSYYLLSISSNNDLRIALKRDIELDYYLQQAKTKNNGIELNLIKKEDKKQEIENINISPKTTKKKRKPESKTSKFTSYIHIYKRNSHSFEHKEDKKDYIYNTKNKKRKKGEKEEDIKYKSPRREKDKNSSTKKKNRKYTANIQHRNYLSIRSPKKTSRDRDKKNISKKKHDKNK